VAAQYGVRVVWDLDAEKQILTVYRSGEPARTLTSDDVREESELLPGFSIRVGHIFR
jgi:Uma2 family endonuclease